MVDLTRSWMNTLLAPVMIAVVGFFINNTLQTKQQSIDKLKFTEQVVADAFEADDPAKALALARFIPRIVDDHEFGTELTALINKFFTDKAIQAARLGDEATFRAISVAASSLAGEGVSVADSIRKNPITRRAQEAVTQQENAVTQLQSGNIEGAERSLDSASKTYPNFKSSNQISKIIKEKAPQLADPKARERVQQELLDSVKSNVSKKIKLPDMQQLIKY